MIDLDGTLLDAEDRISARTVSAIREAARRIPVAIASGRIPEDVGHFARMLGLSCPQISDNGARLLDPLTSRTLSGLSIGEADARRIVTGLEERGFRYFAVDSGRVAKSVEMFSAWQVTIITCAVPDMAESVRISREHSRDGVIAVSARGSRNEWYVNYTHCDAHKGHGARRFSEAVGIDLSQVMAIGDGFNDLQMFETVGMPVAMGHAPEEIKTLAKQVTGSLEEDGVAQAIERFVL